jgi:LmbE family N-acetylglucosaminyl deacetylase
MAASIIYLSPHLDDAVLSCGGLIRQQVISGAKVAVITVFAGQPPDHKISEYAASLHARWGSGADTVQERRREDQAAMRWLGGSARHLHYLDAIYRSDGDRFLYVSDQDLFGRLHPSEATLIDEVAGSVLRMLSWEDSWIYAPLGVGNHVDHQLVAVASRRLIEHTGRAIFYEDYPYVERPGALTSRLEGFGEIGWRPQIQTLATGCLQAKINAVTCYESQLTSLFGGPEEVETRVSAYARAVSPADALAERYWLFVPPKVHDDQREPRALEGV